MPRYRATNSPLGVTVLLSFPFHLCDHIFHHCLLHILNNLAETIIIQIWTKILYKKLYYHGCWGIPLLLPGVIVLNLELFNHKCNHIYVKRSDACLCVLDLFVLPPQSPHTTAYWLFFLGRAQFYVSSFSHFSTAF